MLLRLCVNFLTYRSFLAGDSALRFTGVCKRHEHDGDITFTVLQLLVRQSSFLISVIASNSRSVKPSHTGTVEGICEVDNCVSRGAKCTQGRKKSFGCVAQVLYAITLIPAGLLADRVDRPRLLAGGLAAWSILTMVAAKVLLLFWTSPSPVQ